MNKANDKAATKLLDKTTDRLAGFKFSWISDVELKKDEEGYFDSEFYTPKEGSINMPYVSKPVKTMTDVINKNKDIWDKSITDASDDEKS